MNATTATTSHYTVDAQYVEPGAQVQLRHGTFTVARTITNYTGTEVTEVELHFRSGAGPKAREFSATYAPTAIINLA